MVTAFRDRSRRRTLNVPDMRFDGVGTLCDWLNVIEKYRIPGATEPLIRIIDVQMSECFSRRIEKWFYYVCVKYKSILCYRPTTKVYM